jgi:predicted ATPase/predicted Ser/Thr protein kinase
VTNRPSSIVTTGDRICDECRSKIFADAPQGLCSVCLFKTVLGPLGDEDDATTVSSRRQMQLEFGDYELLEELGRGGQGVVYRARQKSLNRTVALKIIGLGQWASTPHLNRFRREAEAAASLEHPRIVPIYEIGEREGSCYFSMKFVDGGQLDAALGGKPMSTRRAAELFVKIARTVQFAHERGILHRDIKPGNILLDKHGEPYLTDFGLARLIEQKSTVTNSFDVLGTPSYMPPEQAAGQAKELTPAADVYSLGAVFYQMLTGRAPFAGGTPYETIRLVVETEPRNPQLWNSKVDVHLATICLKCLEKDPQRRYPSARELAEDVERWLRREPIRARRSAIFTRGKKRLQRNNLPAQLSSFIGREAEIIEIKQLLAETRLLTLTGAGGCGKTRLALQVAADLLAEYPDGVWLVELAPASDADLVTQLTAKALGIPEQPRRALMETLVDRLRSKRLLLVLDNCEHLLDACATLASALLKTCFNLRILATSREAIGVAGESVWQVPSLATPDPGATMSLNSLCQFEAVQLFRDRAVAVQSRFALTNATAPAVAQICWRVEGIPLAIELAAARMSALSVAQIAERLRDSFELLSHGKRTVMPHHQTLRATIEWSYALLTDAERSLFQRLSVFAGGFDLKAAENVCAGEGIEHEHILDLGTQLVEKSLVLVREQTGTTRYRLLEPIRQYAQNRLRQSGALVVAQRRHVYYFLRVAQGAASRLLGPDTLLAVEELELEHANLLAALAWAAANEPESALKLSNALGWFWERRGYLAEGREWFKKTIAQSPATLVDLQGEAHVRAGRLACWQADYEYAIALTEKGLRLCEQSGNRRWAGMALNNLGGVAAYRGELAQAGSLLEQSLSTGKELGDDDLVWRSLGDLGVVAMFQGNYERARDLSKQAMLIGRQRGDEDGGTMLHVLGDVECACGNTEKAASYYEKTLAIGRKLGHKRALAGGLEGLGKVAFDRGDYTRARAFYEEGLQVANEMGQKSEYAITLGINLAELAGEEGKFDEARRLCMASLRNSQEVGDKESIAAELTICAWLCFASGGQAEAAAQLLGAGEGMRETLGIALSPRQRARHKSRVDVIRGSLDQEVFAAAWARGKVMTIDEAVGYAR